MSASTNRCDVRGRGVLSRGRRRRPAASRRAACAAVFRTEPYSKPSAAPMLMRTRCRRRTAPDHVLTRAYLPRKILRSGTMPGEASRCWGWGYAANRRRHVLASARHYCGDGVGRRARPAVRDRFGCGVHVADRVSRLGGAERTGEPNGAAVRARRADLRRPEKRRDQGLSEPDRHEPDHCCRPVGRGRRLLGSWAARDGAAAGLLDQPVRLRALRVRRPDRWHRAALERRLPDPARADHRRLPGVWAGVATADQRERHDRRRAGARQRLVPAVPEPFDRHALVRPRWKPLRHRRRRRQLQQRRLRPVRCDLCRRPGKLLRRPARSGRHAAESTRCRGWRAAQPERPAHRRPGNPRRRRVADRSGHRRGCAWQPVLLLIGRQRAPHRGLRGA